MTSFVEKNYRIMVSKVYYYFLVVQIQKVAVLLGLGCGLGLDCNIYN